jgi:hypothetical protein
MSEHVDDVPLKERTLHAMRVSLSRSDTHASSTVHPRWLDGEEPDQV